MKSIKIFFIGLAVVFALAGCSASWLDNELTGSTISQEEYDKLAGTTEASVNGLYSLLYQVGGSEHHYFGQKSIDMATDMLAADMAMVANAYGWFTDASSRTCASATSGRNSYIWSTYYQIVLNANMIIRKLSKKENLTAEDKYFYAQALFMRAYSYYNIANLYGPGQANTQLASPIKPGGSGIDYTLAPVYTENDTTEAGLVKEQPASTLGAMYDVITNDLQTSIRFFDEASTEDDKFLGRSSKLFANVDLAKALLAYTYLESGFYDVYASENRWEQAYTLAKEVIDGGNFHIIPLNDVTTTGFVNLDNPSWMWGLNVTSENRSGLASFWGHVDIYTYSYAMAGAEKAIDDALYALIPATDARKEWWDKNKKLCPTGKFYDLNKGTGDDVDRRWLNDIVYMRIEEMYLVGAEAAARAGKDNEAKALLKELLEQRDPETAAKIDAMNNASILTQLYLNWRVEMWGEGRALMTFKRFAQKKTTGTNHWLVKNKEIVPTDYDCIFMLPYGEYSTNNEIEHR